MFRLRVHTYVCMYVRVHIDVRVMSISVRTHV